MVVDPPTTAAASTGTWNNAKNQYNNQNMKDENVEFHPLLSTMDRLKRSIEFYLTAVPVIAKYYGLIGTLKLQELMGSKLTEERILAMWNKQHETGAAKLTNIPRQSYKRNNFTRTNALKMSFWNSTKSP